MENGVPAPPSPGGTMSGGGRALPGGETPKYQLNLNVKRRNVFVTQLEEGRDDEDGDVTQIPVIKESAGRILETSPNALQKTLVLKKEVEYDRVSRELLNKRQEFKERMQELDRKKDEFTQKQLECSEKANKFEKFLKESDAKRRRAVAKYQTESRQNEIRQTEIQELKKQLENQRARQLKLHERLKKNRIYEEFLLKMADNVPENYLEFGVDAPVRAIIRRHETLSLTNDSLVNNLTALADDQENKQHALELLQRKYDTSMLTMNSELSRLQQEHDRILEKNKQLELNFNLNKGHFRNQSVEVGSLMMAITNLAEQCHMKHYGPVDEVELLRKLEMIKEYILEKMQVEKLALQPLESGPPVPSADHQATKLKTTATKEPSKTRTTQRQQNDPNTNGNRRRVSNLGTNF